MKVYFSYAICSDYLCMFLVTICIFHRFVNERPETRCEKKTAALCGHKFLYCSHKNTEPRKSDYNSVRNRLIRKETKSSRKANIR